MKTNFLACATRIAVDVESSQQRNGVRVALIISILNVIFSQANLNAYL